MPEIEGFILVGGASSRMGIDKARLRLDGRDFVERIAAALNAITKRTRLVGAHSKASGWRLPVAADVYANWGSFGGLHAALAACRAPWAAVVACDLPFVNGELFVRLASLREDYDAVAPVQADGHPQPLCALYRVQPCRDCAQLLIASGERRPRSLLRAVNTRWVTPDEWEDIADASLLFNNINTPEDYEQAKRGINDER